LAGSVGGLLRVGASVGGFVGAIGRLGVWWLLVAAVGSFVGTIRRLGLRWLLVDVRGLRGGMMGCGCVIGCA